MIALRLESNAFTPIKNVLVVCKSSPLHSPFSTVLEIRLAFNSVTYKSLKGADTIASFSVGVKNYKPELCGNLYADPDYGLKIFLENASLSEGAFRIYSETGTHAFLQVGATASEFLLDHG